MASALLCVLLLLFVGVCPGGTLEVELSSSEKLFQLESKVQFNCTVKNASESSFNVTWYFKKCNELPADECEGIKFQPISRKFNTYSGDNIYTIEHLVEGPGILKCRVKLELDKSTSANLHIFVTDIKNSTKVLNVWGRPSEILTGDNFTLTCANNVFLGGGSPTWKWIEREIPKNGTWKHIVKEVVPVPVSDSEGLKVETNRSDYNHYTNLTFMNISKRHEGLYTCYGGEKTENVLVVVKDAELPNITSTNLDTLEQKVVKPQSNLTIFCRTQGLPKPTVHWFKDGKPLVTNETVKLKEEDQVLEIQGVRVAHKGVYVCEAENRLGKVNATGTLFPTVVLLHPFIKNSSSNIIEEGTDLELHCAAYAESEKQFNVSWTVPQKLVNMYKEEPDKKYSLSYESCQHNAGLNCRQSFLKIHNATHNDTGEYTCEVRDNTTLSHNSVNLTVVGKNKTSIILQSNSTQIQRVKEFGEDLTIEVHITAPMAVQLEWYGPGGRVLRPGETDEDSKTKFNISHNPDVATLTVKRLNGSDNGYYSLHAHHALNSAWYNITVTLLGSPDNITVNGYDEKFFTLGLKVNLTCSVKSAPPVDISWRFLECDVEKLFDWDQIGWFRYEDHHDSCANFTDACNVNNGCHEITRGHYESFQETHEVTGEFHVQREGLLVCVANNSAGRIYNYRNVYISEFSNMSTSVQIWGAPTKVVMGDTFNLTCVVSSYKHKSLTWYWCYEGQEINLQSNMSGLQVVSDKSNYTLFSHLQFVNISKQQQGTYICKGEPEESAIKFIHVQDKPSSITTGGIISIVLCAVAVLLFILLGLRIKKQKKLEEVLQLAELANFEKGMPESINPDLTIQEQADLLPYKQTWEFPRDKLKLGRQLGSGAFGMVLKAEAWGISDNEEVTTVAVKTTKGFANVTFLKALSSELKILMYVGQHLNIVNLLGACTRNIGKLELYMIVEYCHFGNLHKYLMIHREDFVNQVDSETGQIDPKLGVETLRPVENFTADEPKWRLKYRKSYKATAAPVCTQVLVYWAFQVAKGLEYLASLKVVHGDLAARNVLLADNNVVKICDFGLSNRLYTSYYTRQKAEYDLPVKWMAPESISDRVFSIESDVWSFGIFVWELFSLARSPYPDMEADGRLYLKICDGYRMSQPRFAPDKIYDVMWKCWQIVPRKRPTFTVLARQLGALLDDTLKEHYMELKLPYEKVDRQDSRRAFFNNLINSPGHNGAEGSPSENDTEAPTYLDLIGPLDSTLQSPCSDNINNTAQSPCSDEINNIPQSSCSDEIDNTRSHEVNDVHSQKSCNQVEQGETETCIVMPAS